MIGLDLGESCRRRLGLTLQFVIFSIADKEDFGCPLATPLSFVSIVRLSTSFVVRMCFGQIIHHRAQMGVFLRLLNVPIPGAYGPSADELGL